MQSSDVFDSGVIEIPNHISDHRATFLYVPFSYIRPNLYKRKVWFYKRADYETLNNMILNHDWSFIGNNSVDDACKIFTYTLLNFLNLCIPNKEVTIRPNDKPWYDSEIRSLSKNANDWLKYKQYRNKVNNMKKHAKEVYYNNIEDVVCGWLVGWMF